MLKLFYVFLSIVASAGIAGCSAPSGDSEKDDGLSAFNRDSLTQHIITLSSDEFQGRRPFSPGETKTVNYLASSFMNLGLEPGNSGSYFQDVPMVEITSLCDPSMTVGSGKTNFSLKNMDDYVLWTENTEGSVSLSNDEIVFAGFGVVAPENQWNDYDGLDVKGKVVMVMVNDPGFSTGDSTLFKGKAMTYYGRWTYKFEEAARQGAKGCLIVHNRAAASYAFDVVQNSWSGSQLHLVRGKNEFRCPMEGWLTGDAAKKIILASGQDTTLFHKANLRGFKGFPLGVRLSTSMKVKSVFKSSKNVIGKITGSKHPDQYIVYSAHWDHFGIGKPEKGDSIYNGALDNASGTASLIELARAFKSMKNKPERSIIFLSVTAEEQGLLGSAYYALHPVFPIDSTVANLNVDGINNFGRTKDVTISGAGQSELEDYLKQEVESRGRYIAPENHPEAGHYFRSDHFSFAKVGVPSLTVSSGTDDLLRGTAYGQKMEEEYIEKYYHRPSDEFDAGRWNLEGGLEDIELIFQIGKRISHETSWPMWKDGSEFKARRKK